MKLIPKLTPAQKAMIKSVHDAALKVAEKAKSIPAERATKQAELDRLTAALPDLEKRANAGDLEASREILAYKDQRERMETAQSALDAEWNGPFLREVNDAVTRCINAQKEIVRSVYSDNVRGLLRHIGPCYQREAHAHETIMTFPKINELERFDDRQLSRAEETDAALRQFEVYYGAVRRILKGGAAYVFTY